jgi:D-alanine-D-alanine ligase
MNSFSELTVAVLGGGSSSEREVSLRSAQAVSAALVESGYKVMQIDPAEITQEELLSQLQRCDVVFPVLHGVGWKAKH